jgi:2-polyprenyl-6-methoxyphenol hydroxylase-like FAD-dependent oxidoreductase
MKSYEKILIVGGGPTGLTLACTLGKMGIASRIIDKRDTSSEIPRAINISQQTLQIFNDLGIDESFWNEGLKLYELTIYWKKRRLLNLNYKHINTEYPYFFHLEQSRLEVYLNKLLVRYGNQVERQVSIENIEQNGCEVTVQLRHQNGELEQNIFSMVIGCDGGNSRVRELIDINLQEKKYSSYFMLMDAELDHEFNQKKLHYYLNDEGYLMLVPLPENKFRIIASFNGDYPGNDKINLSKPNFQKIVSERGPGNITIKKVFWTTSAGFFHQLAEKAAVERVFIAGDALHQFSPVGGTNMNTGIQDAYNLGQKILLGIEQNIDCLDLYEKERLSVAKTILNETANATRLLTRNGNSIREENRYLPLMKNRKFIKCLLPKMFSGIDIQNEKFNFN